MSRKIILATIGLTLSLTAACLADEGHEKGPAHTLTCLECVGERETLTDDWFGLGEQLAEAGVTVGLSHTQVYQINLHSALATHRHAGRYTGSYDLEAELDLAKLLGLSGAIFYAHAEGGWSDGLDDSSIGSMFGVNGDAGGDRSMDVTEVFYEQAFFDETMRIRLGKLDLGGGFECRGCPVAFDGNAFANDETAQFLNGALVNNPTIPMPDVGIGLVVYVQPAPWWYVGIGAADAQADGRETGFNTAFHDEDDFFSIFETGVAPQISSANGTLQGTYRVGCWYDPQPKDRFDGWGARRDDVGFYLSCDQVVLRENAEEDDTQGLGLFARYGLAHSDVNEIKSFWSVGAQYQGLIPSRNDDVLGFGVAQGRLANSSGAGFTTSHETVMELYYNAAIAGWLGISPSVQYVCNPGGDRAVNDAVVLGVRAQMAF